MATAAPAVPQPRRNPYEADALMAEFDRPPAGGAAAPPPGGPATPGAGLETSGQGMSQTGIPTPAPRPATPPQPQPAVQPPAAPAAVPGTDTSPGGPTPGGGLEGIQPVPAAGPPPTDPNVAMQQIAAAFQSRMGRAMTPQEQQQLIGAVGYTGGPVTPAQFQQAMALVSQQQAPGGAAPPTTPGAPGAPAAGPGTDPNVALQQIGQAFMTKFGRAMTPQEQQWLAQMAGYTGGNVTPAQLQAAMSAVGNYTGNLQTPVNVTTPPTPQAAAANAQLLALLQKQWGVVDPNAPELKGRIDQHRQSSQRDATRKRAMLAERAAARGAINAGGFDVDTERVLSEQGEGDARFEADVYANELTQQKQQLMQAIQLATQAGLQTEAQRLQEKLGMLDIDLRRYLGKGNLSLGLLGQQLGNQHFNDDLGVRLAQLQQQMNSDAFRQLLGI